MAAGASLIGPWLPATVIVVPYQTAVKDPGSRIATTDYFGAIPPDRVYTRDGILVCRHDLDAPARGPLIQRLGASLLRRALGRGRAWQGLDVFYFEGRQIAEKHSFSRTSLPLMRPELQPEPWRGPADLESEARQPQKTGASR